MDLYDLQAKWCDIEAVVYWIEDDKVEWGHIIGSMGIDGLSQWPTIKRDSRMAGYPLATVFIIFVGWYAWKTDSIVVIHLELQAIREFHTQTNPEFMNSWSFKKLMK